MSEAWPDLTALERIEYVTAVINWAETQNTVRACKKPTVSTVCRRTVYRRQTRSSGNLRISLRLSGEASHGAYCTSFLARTGCHSSVVCKIGLADLWDALAQGMDDFLAFPSRYILIAIYPLLGLAIAAVT